MSVPKYYEFLNSVKILSGENALDNIEFELFSMKASQPLIISNLELEKIGTVKTVIKCLNNIVPKAVFLDVPSDSSIDVVNTIAKVYNEKNCDSIIAIGGGSVIDTAKGVKMLISTGESNIMKLRGSEKIQKGKRVPFVVVPTTSGTGSEATLVAVIYDSETLTKLEFVSYELLPDIAVLDPRMTLTLPKMITVSTGMDALSHAIEADTCLQKNPLSSAYAFAAMKLIGEYLAKTVDDGANVENRLAMSNASLMAGIAFSNSMVGLVHAIGHSIGGLFKVPHGVAMSILLPHVMEFNSKSKDVDYSNVLLALKGAEWFSSIKKADRNKMAILAVCDLQKMFKEKINFPSSLRDVVDKGGQQLIDKDSFVQIAEKSINDGAIVVNARAAGVEEIVEILKKAYDC